MTPRLCIHMFSYYFHFHLQIVYDEKLKKWVDKNASPEDETAPPPPPPMGGFGMPMKSPPSNSPPVVGGTPPSVELMVPPSVGMTMPSRPGQPRRTGSTLSARSNTSNVSDDFGVQNEPKNEPVVMQEPAAQSMTNRGKTDRKTLLQQSKGATKPESEEDKKPAGPPSMFSLKAQGGRRGNYHIHLFSITYLVSSFYFGTLSRQLVIVDSYVSKDNQIRLQRLI